MQEDMTNLHISPCQSFPQRPGRWSRDPITINYLDAPDILLSRQWKAESCLTFFIFLWLFHSFVFLNVKMQKWNSKVTHDISMRNCSLQIASNHSLMRSFLQSCGAAMIRLDYRPRCPHLISKYHTLTGPPLKDSPQVKTSSINIRPLCEDCSSCQFKQNIKVWLQGGEKKTQLKHKGNAETIPLHFCWRKAIKERKTEQQNSKSQ